MATDDERREVAERLRELHLGGGSKDLIERTLSDAIGAWHKNGMSWDFITERLADLIDPDTTTDTTTDTTKSAAVSPERDDTRERLARALGIDLPALLALADEMESLCGPWDGCGKHYAPLIREACGEAV